MILEILFFFSGAGIVLLIFTKVRETKLKRTPLLLRVISLGDARMKNVSHKSAHFYADSKEDLVFFWQKQFPLHTRNAWNKFVALMEDRVKVLKDDLQGSRFFKKNGDISEFFKNVSEKEDETLEIQAAEKDLADSQNEKNAIK